MSQKITSSLIEAKIKTKHNFSTFWILPIIALIIVGHLVWSYYKNRGHIITISLNSADGIIAGRTPIRYQGIEVGKVKSVFLSKDLKEIKVLANINSSMKEALRSETRFWLVTPKASLSGLSGIDALISGNYIGMTPGKGKLQNHFTALDTQPKYHLNNGDLIIHLHASDLGALNTNSLVYFRKIPVGKIYDYEIDINNQGVIINVLIESRFAKLAKKNSRFWNISGIDANLSLSGTKIKFENFSAMVNGAIAFDSPKESKPAEVNDNFSLYEDLAHSQRGAIIQLALSDANGLKEGSTPLMYRGLQVGQLTKINLNSNGLLNAEMIVDPSVVDLLRDNTRLELCGPHFSLNSNSINSLLTGNTFELVPGDGKPKNNFVIFSSNKSLLQKPGVITLILNSLESYGIDTGQPLTIHGIQVGQVLERILTKKGVIFYVAIDPKYRELLHSDSKFVVNSRIDIKVGLNGVEFISASANEWLKGGINILPGKKGHMLDCYPLYSSLDKAIKNSVSDSLTTTLTLSSKTLPDIQPGSMVLYHKFEVGEVVIVHPRIKSFDIELYIKPEYRYLLTKNSVFWAEESAKLQLSNRGITVQPSPLSRVFRGAISFDNLSNVQEINNQHSYKRILYPSEISARATGHHIILNAFNADKLSEGMPIRYLGIDIGQIQKLTLVNNINKVQASAVFYPEYEQMFARKGSRFSIVTSRISVYGIEHFDTLLQPYINAEPGSGNIDHEFELQEFSFNDSRYINGLNIVVEASEASSIATGTPVLFRGIEVGTVTNLILGSSYDRVMINLCISKHYRHLVRNNSVFWLASGYSFDFSLTKGIVKTGTFNQFIRGGIAFATPLGKSLAPKAQSGKHFVLLKHEPKEWCK